jgi:hypothetical protein
MRTPMGMLRGRRRGHPRTERERLLQRRIGHQMLRAKVLVDEYEGLRDEVRARCKEVRPLFRIGQDLGPGFSNDPASGAYASSLEAIWISVIAETSPMVALRTVAVVTETGSHEDGKI